MNIMQPIRLSQLSHGGGCGCKLAPSVLQQLLSSHPVTARYKQLLVGVETGDDAGVWELDNGTCVMATTDFFMPMVDDPHDFGRIAATNALSDICAMGGTPIMALAILGMPVDKIPAAMVRKILEGGASICEVAGIPLAGGHSIESAGADLRPGGDRYWSEGQYSSQLRCANQRQAHSDQGAWRRHLFRRLQEGRSWRRRLRRVHRNDHTAQSRRRRPGEGRGGSCHDGRHRFRLAWARARNGTRSKQDHNDQYRSASLAQ